MLITTKSMRVLQSKFSNLTLKNISNGAGGGGGNAGEGSALVSSRGHKKGVSVDVRKVRK